MILTMAVKESQANAILEKIRGKLCNAGYHDDISLETSVSGKLEMKNGEEKISITYADGDLKVDIIPYNSETMGFLHNFLSRQCI